MSDSAQCNQNLERNTCAGRAASICNRSSISGSVGKDDERYSPHGIGACVHLNEPEDVASRRPITFTRSRPLKRGTRAFGEFRPRHCRFAQVWRARAKFRRGWDAQRWRLARTSIQTHRLLTFFIYRDEAHSHHKILI